MKRLMFALAISAGLAVNAGTVNWEFWDDSTDASKNYTLYLMEGTLTDGSRIDSIKDSDSAKTYVSSALDSAVMDGSDALYATGQTGELSGGMHNFYALLFNGDSIDNATDYLVLGTFNANVPGSGGASISMDLAGRTASTAGWAAVSGSTPTPGPSGIPEPTSGLLLLVGGAMLALRRKQK